MKESTRICKCCKKEKELNQKNFVVINRGNEVSFLPKCRECIRYENLSKLTVNLGIRQNIIK